MTNIYKIKGLIFFSAKLMLSKMGESKVLSIILFLIQTSESIYPPGCSYVQKFVLNRRYIINNMGYPDKYVPRTDCLWVGTSPGGSIIKIHCEFNIPRSPNCRSDHLKVSLMGDRNFRDGERYCGLDIFDLTTTSNKFAIALLATSNSPGGRLFCTVQAIKGTHSCECGLKKQTRIIGGLQSGINEYPMMAGLIDSTVRNEVICGATIISNRYVLTAAHCLSHIPLLNMGVLVGDWDISTGRDTASAKVYLVEWAAEHPLFDLNTQTNDIAIVRTLRTIGFNAHIGPACLPFRYVNAKFLGQNVTYLGWGQLIYNGPKSDILYKADVKVISNAQCQAAYRDLKTITEQQMCTYTRRVDSCQGDSGGPALWTDSSNRLHLVGVISYGYACTLRPGINARVTSYLNWIQSVTSDVNYCIK